MVSTTHCSLKAECMQILPAVGTNEGRNVSYKDMGAGRNLYGPEPAPSTEDRVSPWPRATLLWAEGFVGDLKESTGLVSYSKRPWCMAIAASLKLEFEVGGRRAWGEEEVSELAAWWADGVHGLLLGCVSYPTYSSPSPAQLCLSGKWPTSVQAEGLLQCSTRCSLMGVVICRLVLLKRGCLQATLPRYQRGLQWVVIVFHGPPEFFRSCLRGTVTTCYILFLQLV